MSALIIGAGEIGLPLAEILGADMRDVNEPVGLSAQYDWLHICYPWSDEFVNITVDYVERYRPAYCVIHSTAVPRASASVQQKVLASVAYSPVRGRHGSMAVDMRRYLKFVAGRDDGIVCHYFEQVGIPSCPFDGPMRELELAKLWETSYTALLIVWAQELKRYEQELDIDPGMVLEITRDVKHLPDHRFYPGFIGGHCLMQNLELLDRIRPSLMVDAVKASNEEAREWQDGKRHRAAKL